MQQSPFICRSCLAQLRRSWRPKFATTSPRLLTSTASTRGMRVQAAAPTGGPDALPTGGDGSLPWSNRDLVAQPISRSDGRTPSPTARELDNKHLGKESAPTGGRYTAHDAVLWDIFDETLNGGGDNAGGFRAHEGLEEQQESTSSSRRLHQGGLSSRGRMKTKRSGERTSKDVQSAQLAYLKSVSDPKKWDVTRKEFKQWKRNLARLEDGRPVKFMDWVITKTASLQARDSPDKMRDSWTEIDPGRRSRICGLILMCALQADPVTSHLLLRAIFQDPLPPAYMIQDTIQYLVYKLRGKPLSDTFTEELYETVLFVLENSPRGYLRLRQNTVYSLMKHVGVEKKRALYHALVESQHQLHAYTLLQFASAFSRDPTTKELSLEILENLLKADALDINTPHGASLCTSILTMKEDDLLSGSVSTSPAELFQCLLDCGLNPNVITYTAIIRNLCLTRELGIAWQVFDVMKQHRIEPDAYLYSTLLNGSKLCGDFHSLRRVATMARTAQIRDPVVWNDLLHSVFLSAVIEARATGMKPPRVLPAFGSMLRLYARFFNLEPLKKLLLVDVKQLLTEAEQAPAHHWSFTRKLEPLWDDLAPLAPDELIEPTTSTLGTMILGYVRSFSQPYNVIAFYSHFRSLLKEGDPVTVHIVQMEGTLVHDIVIKALAEWRGMLRVALDVVSDMLKDATPTPAEGGDSTSAAALAAPRRHPPPSVHTWSILLNGFMYFRQKRQGERILQMMREHGVAPNLVTWNTLAAGYARLQEVGRTVRALQRLEAAGHEADDFTLRAFSYLKNKGRAISQMESMIERKKAARVIEEARSVGQEGEQLEAHEEEEVEEGLRRLENAVEELAKMTEEDGASGEGLSRGVEDDELDIQDSERGREHAGSWR